MLKPEPEKHVWSLLLQKIVFSLENFGELLQNVLITYTYNGEEKHITCERFKNAASRVVPTIVAAILER